MAVKDMKGNVVAGQHLPSRPIVFLIVAAVAVLVPALVGYRIYDCGNFNRLNEQRLRQLENYGAVATLRSNKRDWKYPWLVKDVSPIKLVFFDHPRFMEKPLVDDDMKRIVRLIGGLPNVESVHVARKEMPQHIVDQLGQQLGAINFTFEKVQ